MDDTTTTVPTHVGFILDGNRRWARMHSIPEFDGHLAGYNALREVVEDCFDRGIQYVTIYAFSNENWKREAKEVSGLMRLAFQMVSKDLKTLIRQNVRLRFLGREEGIGPRLLDAIRNAEEKTKDLKRGTFCVCFNYGGQQELIDAARQCVADGLSADQIDEAAISQRLYAGDVPPIDIVVRTSGEQRLSNFMLWRTAYSEFLFLEKFWPDMTKDDVTSIIEEYNRRSRRFGG